MDYQPTDNDVVRARLRTLGVQEHSFVFEQGRTAGRQWLMYDVGGTRSSVINSLLHTFIFIHFFV